MHKGMGRRAPRAVARRKLLTAAIVAGAVPALVAGQALLAGAANAALFAIAWLARSDPSLSAKLADFRARQTTAVRAMTLPPKKK